VIRAPRSEKVLLGGGSLEEACKLIQEEVRPITDVRSTADYRRAMAGVLLRRVVESLG
jgi:CO/xanthine dehydrogenase FAD-binding subunit